MPCPRNLKFAKREIFRRIFKSSGWGQRLCRPGCAAVLEFAAQVEVKPQLQKKTASFAKNVQIDKSLCALCILEVQTTVNGHYFIVTSESTHVMSVTFREFVVRSTLAMSTLSWIKVCNHGRCDGGKRGLAEASLRRSQDFMQKLPKQAYKNRKIKDRKTTPRLKSSRFCTEKWWNFAPKHRFSHRSPLQHPPKNGTRWADPSPGQKIPIKMNK